MNYKTCRIWHSYVLYNCENKILNVCIEAWFHQPFPPASTMDSTLLTAASCVQTKWWSYCNLCWCFQTFYTAVWKYKRNRILSVNIDVVQCLPTQKIIRRQLVRNSFDILNVNKGLTVRNRYTEVFIPFIIKLWNRN